jgi:predicted RecA/RadA family phage recombinase
VSKGILASALTAIALTAIVAGCGGGDDSTGASTGGDETVVVLSKAEFIKQGDEICTAANDQNQKEAEEFAEENNFELEKASEEQLEEAVAEVFAPSLSQQAEELAALGAPEGDEEQIEAIVVSLEDAAGEIEDDPTVVFGPDALKEPKELAIAYGFKVCGAQ